jgi:hypothetical protein
MSTLADELQAVGLNHLHCNIARPSRPSVRNRAATVFLLGALGAIAYGQEQRISLNAGSPTINTSAFTARAVLPLNKGDSIPAQFVMGHGCDQVWDVRVHAFVSEHRTIKYPVLGIIKCSGSSSQGLLVFASATVMRTETRPDASSRSGGYIINSKQTIKTGQVVPSLVFMHNGLYSIVSIEPAQGQRSEIVVSDQKTNPDAPAGQPWLTIFDERLQPNDRILVLDAWRAANDLLSEVLEVPGLFKLLPQ